MVYALILYTRLIVPYGEGNATHERFNFVNIIITLSIGFKIFDSFLFPKNACSRKVGLLGLHDVSLIQYEKGNQRLSAPHSPSLPYRYFFRYYENIEIKI